MSSASCLSSACQNFLFLGLTYSIHHRFRSAYLAWPPFHVSFRALNPSLLPLSLRNRALSFHSLLLRLSTGMGKSIRSIIAKWSVKAVATVVEMILSPGSSSYINGQALLHFMGIMRLYSTGRRVYPRINQAVFCSQLFRCPAWSKIICTV